MDVCFHSKCIARIQEKSSPSILETLKWHQGQPLKAGIGAQGQRDWHHEAPQQDNQKVRLVALDWIELYNYAAYLFHCTNCQCASFLLMIDIERKWLFLQRNIPRVSDIVPLKSLCLKCQRIEMILFLAWKCKWFTYSK